MRSCVHAPTVDRTRPSTLALTSWPWTRLTSGPLSSPAPCEFEGRRGSADYRGLVGATDLDVLASLLVAVGRIRAITLGAGPLKTQEEGRHPSM